MPTRTCPSRTCSRIWDSRRNPLRRIAPRSRGGRTWAKRTGASRTSRPSASRTRKSPPCSSRSEREQLAAGHRRAFLLRARQGQRGSRRLRRRLAVVPARQPAPPAAGLARSAGHGRPPHDDHRHLQRRIPARPRRPRLRGSRTDLHRRPAPLGLDADRADPGLAFTGRGHGGTAEPRADCRLGGPVSERPRRVPGSRARFASQGLA